MFRNGNYQTNSYKGSKDYSSGYDSDYSRGDYYRRKRNYDLNVDQDTPVMAQNQDRLIPQQARLLSMNSYNQQIQLPSIPIRQCNFTFKYLFIFHCVSFHSIYFSITMCR